MENPHCDNETLEGDIASLELLNEALEKSRNESAASIESVREEFKTQVTRLEGRLTSSINELQRSLREQVRNAVSSRSSLETRINTYKRTLTSSLSSLRSEVSRKHPKERYVYCPSSYTRNPHSKTCIRHFELSKTWSEAKQYCEARGEYLATFETLESSVWFVNLRKTDSAWSSGYEIWVGGQYVSGKWRWRGKTNALADTVYWGRGEPTGRGEYCVSSYEHADYGFNNDECHHRHYFVCEKTR
ncbi:C-type lectin domain family 10 member A-like [Watersipora subatra]|uniref:C-type lectin domain family 10 member A-like n=1 Tax=Watersipora subatra TaxID=2589382 RepID=UPI00355B722E